jgi:hypothetical protein
MLDDIIQFIGRMRALDSLTKHMYCLTNNQLLFQLRVRCEVVKDWYHMVGSK